MQEKDYKNVILDFLKKTGISKAAASKHMGISYGNFRNKLNDPKKNFNQSHYQALVKNTFLIVYQEKEMMDNTIQE